MSTEIEVKKINIQQIAMDIADLRVHPEDMAKVFSIVARLAAVAGAVEALTQMAGPVFAAHAQGNYDASAAYYEVLLSLETSEPKAT